MSPEGRTDEREWKVVGVSDRDPFCASSPEAAAMSDGEFWEAVYHQDGPDIEGPDDEAHLGGMGRGD